MTPPCAIHLSRQILMHRSRQQHLFPPLLSPPTLPVWLSGCLASHSPSGRRRGAVNAGHHVPQEIAPGFGKPGQPYTQRLMELRRVKTVLESLTAHTMRLKTESSPTLQNPSPSEPPPPIPSPLCAPRRPVSVWAGWAASPKSWGRRRYSQARCLRPPTGDQVVQAIPCQNIRGMVVAILRFLACLGYKEYKDARRRGLGAIWRQQRRKKNGNENIYKDNVPATMPSGWDRSAWSPRDDHPLENGKVFFPTQSRGGSSNV